MNLQHTDSKKLPNCQHIGVSLITVFQQTKRGESTFGFPAYLSNNFLNQNHNIISYFTKHQGENWKKK